MEAGEGSTRHLLQFSEACPEQESGLFRRLFHRWRPGSVFLLFQPLPSFLW